MSDVREEFGVICDRRSKGLGKALLGTGATIAAAERQADGCWVLTDEHPHLIVKRTVVKGAWSEPLAGALASRPDPQENNA